MSQMVTLKAAIFCQSPTDVTCRDIVFTYLNAVQLIYDSSRLSNRLRLVVVRLEIMKTQPSDLSTSGGNIESYLENFCRSVGERERERERER